MRTSSGSFGSKLDVPIFFKNEIKFVRAELLRDVCFNKQTGESLEFPFSLAIFKHHQHKDQNQRTEFSGAENSKEHTAKDSQIHKRTMLTLDQKC